MRKFLQKSGCSRRNKGILFLLPSLLGTGIFVILPFADVCRRSFLTAVTGEFRGLLSYREVIRNEAFRLAAGNSLRFAFTCLPLLTGLGLVLALGLSRLMGLGENRRCRAGKAGVGVLKSLFLFPMAVPSATVVLVWKMVFDKAGFLNLWLDRLGLETRDFMGTGLSFWVLVGSYLWKNIGYTVVLWMAGIAAVPTEQLEAASVDGAGRFSCFTRVLLPQLRPVCATICVLSFLNSFKVFREAYLVAGSYPQESMYLLQHLFHNWFVNLELDKMAAGSVLMAAVLLAVILPVQKIWEEDGDA